MMYFMRTNVQYLMDECCADVLNEDEYVRYDEVSLMNMTMIMYLMIMMMSAEYVQDGHMYLMNLKAKKLLSSLSLKSIWGGHCCYGRQEAWRGGSTCRGQTGTWSWRPRYSPCHRLLILSLNHLLLCSGARAAKSPDA